MLSRLRLVATAALCIPLGSCGEDLDPYQLLRGLRVLAVQADPPQLNPGDTTTLTPVLFQEEAKELTYEWSWCPFRGSPAEGSPCAVTEDELNAQLGLDPGTLTYDLGNEATATFTHFMPGELIEALCSPPEDAADLPDFVALPSCDNGFAMSFKLKVSDGDSTVEVLKKAFLLAEASATPNQNPEIEGVGAARRDDDSDDEPKAADATTLADDMATSFAFGESYRMFVTLPDGTAETFQPPRGFEEDEAPQPRAESLYLSWFITEGETLAARTGFIEGASEFDVLVENNWEVPLAEDVDNRTGELILVIRDERGGTGWLRRPFRLNPEGL